MSFNDIAPIVNRPPAATRQLASRVRRRIQATAAIPDSDLARQRQPVGAFLAAERPPRVPPHRRARHTRPARLALDRIPH